MSARVPVREDDFEVEGKVARWRREGRLTGRTMVLFAHGAGAPWTSPFMEHVTQELLARDLSVARFHFPYMERMARGSARRPPDSSRVLLATWRRMLEIALAWRGVGPVFLAGKSMGGRIASMVAAEGVAEQVRGLVYFGYPLHPPGRTDKLRSEHLPKVERPQLFVTGTKDSLCDLTLLRGVLRSVRRSKLHLVEGGDHSLAQSRSRPFENSASWIDVTAEFLTKH